MIYKNAKIFYPRNSSDEVWYFFVKALDFEHASNDVKFFSWSFTDVVDDERLSIGSKWLIDNGASIFETVILDMS